MQMSVLLGFHLILLCTMSVAAAAYTFHITVKPVDWAVEADAVHWSSLVTLPSMVDVKSVEVLNPSPNSPCLDQWRWLNGRELWINVKRHCLHLDLAVEVADLHVAPAVVASMSTGVAEINASYPQLSLDLITSIRNGRTSGPITVTMAVPIKVAFVCDMPEGSVWNVQNLDRTNDHGIIVFESLEARLSHRLAPLTSVQIVTSRQPPYRVDQPVVSWIGRRWGEPYTNHLVSETVASQPITPVLFHSGYRSCFCDLNVVCRPESGHVSRQAVRTLDAILTTRPISATMVSFTLFESPETNTLFTGLVFGVMILVFMGALVSFISNGSNLLPNTRSARAFHRSVFDGSVLRADEENSHRLPMNTRPWDEDEAGAGRKRKVYQGQTETNLPVQSSAAILKAQTAVAHM